MEDKSNLLHFNLITIQTYCRKTN